MSERVLVAMSGGVDSSVALLKVLEAGYEAIGITMKLWEYRDVDGRLMGESGCCPVEAINNAREVCVTLGVPHYTLDFQEAFKARVIDDFVSEYLAGRTPNPCVQCNSHIKWDTFLQEADRLGAARIATGHYAIIDRDAAGSFRLLPGIDQAKDQSYVLWGIPRQSLPRTLLPLGNLTKKQVRREAARHNLPTADVAESQDICFVTDNDYPRFLEQVGGDQVASIGAGDIVDEGGQQLGRHPGYTHFTVGQRRRLGIAHSEPLYVKEIKPESNRIVVAPKTALFGQACLVGNLNWLVDQPPASSIQVTARLRYNSTGSPARLIPNGETVRLEFDQPQLAITAGQSAVFYDGQGVLGGGVIRGAEAL